MPSIRRDMQAKLRKDKRRLHELHRCQTDLWYLASKVLKYQWNPGAGRFGKGLTEHFHKPICDWRQAHRDKSFLGFWMGRWHHKTTIVIAEMIQDWLIDPSMALLYWHAVDDRASEVVGEILQHIMQNEELRALDPVSEYPMDYHIKSKRGTPYRMFPPANSKRFGNTTGFTLGKSSITDPLDRRPNPSRWQSLLARGAGSEVTGAHGNKGYLDDVIGANDIEDGQLPKKKAWFQGTVLNVVDDMIIRASGTPWGDWGMYRDWKEDKDWWTLFVPGSTEGAYYEDGLDLARAVDWTSQKIDLVPDYKFDHPVYGLPADRKTMKKRLQILERQMKADFPPQIMVDESPEGEKPWSQSTCEHFIGMRSTSDAPGAAGPGTVWVLSDPAPATVGSRDETKQKMRGDGTKDPWAFSVVKVRRRGERREAILLDGSASKTWSTPEGMDEACRLMKKWRTNKCIHEAYGGLVATYDMEMQKAVVRNGTNWMRYDRKHKPVQFVNSYAKGAKNNRFADLAAMAQLGEFMICTETCPEEFLNGKEGQRHSGFLDQARGWRPLPNGRNSLSHDDHADVVSRCTDPRVWEYAGVAQDWVGDYDPRAYAVDDDDDYKRRSRHCAA